MASRKVKEMKRTEKKVRDEISGIIINHHPEVGKERIGKIFIEVYKYGDDLLIDCGSFYDVVFIRLIIDSEDVVRRFIVAPIGKGLTQLRWLLEQIKKR